MHSTTSSAATAILHTNTSSPTRPLQRKTFEDDPHRQTHIMSSSAGPPDDECDLDALVRRIPSRCTVNSDVSSVNTTNTGIDIGGMETEKKKDVQCCCGRIECAYLQSNCSALDDLEQDVRTAAQLGQVRYDLIWPISGSGTGEGEILTFAWNVRPGALLLGSG